MALVPEDALKTRFCTVYGLVGPDGAIRYVGQTTRPLWDRVGNHRQRARSGARGELHQWIRGIESSGGRLGIVPLRLGAIWNATEVQVIAEQLRIGACLFNKTPGGEHRGGWRNGAAARARRSEIAREQAAGEGNRAKLLKATLLRYARPGAREEQAAFLRSIQASPKRAAAARLAMRDPAHRQLKSEQMKRIWAERKARKATA